MLIGAAAAGVATVAPGRSATAAPLANVDLVVAGTPASVVVRPDAPAAGVTAAINDLVAYVQKSTTATLPVLTQAQLAASGTTYAGDARIYVGFVGPEGDPALAAAVAGLDADGFAIATYGNTLAILGPTEFGTRNGVSEFLERFVGVRWLMPTSVGDHVPSLSTLSLAPTSITQEPVFLSRTLSGVTTGPNPAGEPTAKAAWMARQRLRARIIANHNLHNVFPPATYRTTHPEYYPVVDGVHVVPPNGDDYGWQPCFSEPGTVGVAVQYVIDTFNDDPQLDAVSLAVNDGAGFSESDPVDPGGLNSQGHAGRSVVYYGWLNDVAAQVAAVHPNKIIAVLAYNATADPPPPPFVLHPMVVPVLTRDRHFWANATEKASEQQRQLDWEAAASRIGWYDYIYGTPYVLPRITPHLMGEAYSYAAGHSTASMYAEIYPNWGEGPKAWLASKLFWNPALNVDTLLNEWYDRAVGPAAAPYLKQYYDAWENFWTSTIPPTDWFRSRTSFNYLNFGDAHYVASLPAGFMDTAAGLLDEVQTRAVTTQQLARATLLKEIFAYYRASADSYPRRTTTTTTPSTATAALALIDWVEAAPAAYAQRFTLRSAFASSPLKYQHLAPPTWFYWNGAQLWALVDYLKAHEPSGGPITSRLTSEAASGPMQGFAALALAIAEGTATSLVTNGSFETASGDGAAGWSRWISSTGTLVRSTEQAKTGVASLKATALVRGGPHRVITTANAGLVALRTQVLAAGSAASWHGTFQYQVNLQSATGAGLGSRTTRPVPVLVVAGAWRPIAGLFDIPATVDGTAVDRFQLVIVLDGFEADPALYIDDVEVYQAP